MRFYRCLLIAVYGSFLFSFPSASETNLDSPKELSCEALRFFFSLWKDSGYGKDNRVERAAWIIQDSNGNQVFQKWRNSAERGKQIWDGPVPASVVGLVHTHPARRHPKPSPADVSVAKQLKIDVYVISEDGIWKSNPAGKISQVLKYVNFKEGISNCQTEENAKSFSQ